MRTNPCREVKEILDELKKNMVSAYIDEAVLFYFGTPEGKNRHRRWKRKDKTDSEKNNKPSEEDDLIDD